MPTNDQVGRRPPPGASRRVTVVPPIFGPAPTPPASIISALDLLYTLHSEARDPRDAAAQGGFDAFRFVVAALFDEPYRPRAHGLSARATRTWLDRVWAVLPEEDLVALRQYTDTCHAWHMALRAVVTDDAADPDWDMTSAQLGFPPFRRHSRAGHRGDPRRLAGLLPCRWRRGKWQKSSAPTSDAGPGRGRH